MKIITISREFGSGGRELGKRLAERLGFDYYDREIITAIAEQSGLDEGYVEMALEKQDWQARSLTFGRSFAGIHGMQQMQTKLLVVQKHVIEEIAKMGKDCVIVGRNADVLLADKKPFRIFVCAGMEAKIRRCMERALKGEVISPKEARQNIRQMDKARAKTREILGGGKWGESSAYHLTVNTEGWDMEELASAVEGFVLCWYGRNIK